MLRQHLPLRSASSGYIAFMVWYLRDLSGVNDQMTSSWDAEDMALELLKIAAVLS